MSTGQRHKSGRHQLGHSDGAKDTETRALFCPVIFFGAQVLTDKRSHGHGKAGDGKEAEPFYFGIAPQPAMAILPKLLILACTTTLAMEMMEF